MLLLIKRLGRKIYGATPEPGFGTSYLRKLAYEVITIAWGEGNIGFCANNALTFRRWRAQIYTGLNQEV